MTGHDRVVVWAERELTKYVENLIVPEPNRTISVFGKYLLVPQSGATKVIEDGDTRATLRDTRTAISWCVARKFCRLDLARQIQTLDAAYRRFSHDIHQRRQLAQRSRKLDFRDTVNTKLQSKIQHKIEIENQLEKCIDLTKYLQRKGFQNETARTRYA